MSERDYRKFCNTKETKTALSFKKDSKYRLVNSYCIRDANKLSDHVSSGDR